MLRMLRNTIALTLLSVPSLLLAQGGGVSVWSIRGTLPDTAQQLAKGMLSDIDLRLTMATDGDRVSILITPGPDLIASSLTEDLSTVRMQIVTSSSNDTVHIGAVLPPGLAAQMGGSLGFRLDMPLPASFLEGTVPDSLAAALIADSLKARQPEYQNTGRSDIVAGLECEVWTMTEFGADPEDFAELCLAPQPGSVKAVSDAMRGRFASIIEKFEGMATDSSAPFGGKGLMPIRFRVQGDGDMTFELVSVSDDVPAATYFELPAGLDPFPMQMLQGMTGAAAEPTDT